MLNRYGSLDGRGANWHPTRAFHMLRGEAIVWIFSLIIHEMLTMYQQDLLTKSRKDILDGKFMDFLSIIYHLYCK